MLIATILFSTSGLFVKLLEEDVYTIAGFRALFALFPFAIIYRRELWNVNAQMFLSAILYACTCLFFVIATKKTTAANAIFLQFTAPLYVLIGEPLIFGLKYKKLDILTVLVILVGMGCFFQDDLGTGDMIGNLIALVSGVTLAGFMLNQRKNSQQYHASAIFWGNILLVGFCFFFLPSDMAPSPVEWGMLLFLGVFQIGIAFSFFTFALKRVLAVEVSLMGTLEPILNPIWVVVGYGEFPTTWAMAGGGIIVGMLIYRTIYLSRRSAIADEEF